MSYEFDIASQQYIDTQSSEYAFADISSKSKQKKSDAMSVSDALLIAKTGLESIKLNIVGEISEISNKPGYKAIYFTIKDKKSALPCLMWKNRFVACDIDLKAGDLVEVRGKFSLYAAKGRMNFDVAHINLAGEGELRMQVARLAKKLQSLGLTDPSRKKSIPKMSKRIAVVTSPRGAVIHDVLRTLRRRMPLVKVSFVGTAVEGNDAPMRIIKALDCADNACADVILLVRGGGSFEDLMPFNDEDLAMKISSCKTPIVTGIGHEPDTTIADLVSDFRASTPTAAAEAVSINISDYIEDQSKRLDSFKNIMKNRLRLTGEKLDSIASRPIFADARHLYAAEHQSLDYTQEKLARLLEQLLLPQTQNLEHLFGRLKQGLKESTKSYESEIAIAAAKLHDKSPLVVVSRGYSITHDSQKKLVKSVEQVATGDSIDVQVSDGHLNCEIKNIKKEDIQI